MFDQEHTITRKAAVTIFEVPAVRVEALKVSSGFRTDFHGCPTARADALFELADALLCTDGPVKTLVDLALAREHRRGHGTLYDGLNAGRIEVARLRETLAGLPPPRHQGRIALAVDVSDWLRPDAATSPERLFCHVHGRGKNNAQMIPGRPYSFVVAPEPGRTSRTAILDAVRPGPADDATAVTADQLRDVVQALIAAGRWTPGDPDVLIVADAGHDITRPAFVLDGLPVELLGRLRGDRVFLFPVPPGVPGTNGRPPEHGAMFNLKDPAGRPAPAHTTTTDTDRYGIATATGRDRPHPRLTHRTRRLDHHGDLPVIEGTIVRLAVDRPPGDGDPKPVWPWWSGTGAAAADVDRLRQAFPRRFDIEHTFKMIKGTLGWTRPKLRDPAAADRWTALVIAVHTRLRPARPLAIDLRRPWERPVADGMLTPARVRRGFRNIHPMTAQPAGAPKPGKPGPGRPPGSENHRPAPHHDVGKTVKRDLSLTARQNPAAG